MKVNALAVNQPNEKLKPFTYELGELGSEDIDVKVLYCGICHSDMSMMNNEWGLTQYPIVPRLCATRVVTSRNDDFSSTS